MNPLILDTNFDDNSKIIVALDYDNERDVMNFVSQISPKLCKLKVGKELFTACGHKLVEKLVISGYDVFLDLKFHDIPNTVYKACKLVANLGVWMLNVHASGGSNMLKMAKQAIDESLNKPLLIAVTVLTSLEDSDLVELGINESINSYAVRLGNLAYNCGLDGVVCSAEESPQIKLAISDKCLTVTPGIRLSLEKNDDQTRIVTPAMAIDNQVDYMVIGRPITRAKNPFDVLNSIVYSTNK